MIGNTKTWECPGNYLGRNAASQQDAALSDVGLLCLNPQCWLEPSVLEQMNLSHAKEPNRPGASKFGESEAVHSKLSIFSLIPKIRAPVRTRFYRRSLST